jgi:predicted dinucleotide-binding enzyme
MRIATIGAGVVGRTLAGKLAAAGHDVTIGVRSPDKARAEHPDLEAAVVAVAEALDGAQTVILAIPGVSVDAFLAEHGAALGERIVIDAANRIGDRLGDRTEMNSVAAIAAAAPRAHIYRAFNSLGWENFARPRIGDVQADLLYCGPDDESRPLVDGLIADVGLRPLWVGGLETLMLIDALGGLWGALAFGRDMGRRLFFKVVTPA